jgi:hypothetical protein
MRPLASSLTLASCLLVVHVARAEPPTKEQCIQADVRAQEQYRAHKFGDAQKTLAECLDPSCPEVVRSDCAQRLDDLQKAMPTIIFSAKDADGADLTAVRVTMDGQLFASALNGLAVSVEPGEHTFEFTGANAPPVKRTFVLVEGERNRHEVVVLETPKKVTPKVEPALASGGVTEVKEPGGKPQRIAGFALGGVGLVALGFASYFGWEANELWSDSQAACSTSACPNHARAVEARSHALTSATASTALFIGGGAMVATGLFLVLSVPRSESRSALRLAPMVGSDRGGLILFKAF